MHKSYRLVKLSDPSLYFPLEMDPEYIRRPVDGDDHKYLTERIGADGVNTALMIPTHSAYS